MRIKMFATQNKVHPGRGNARGLKLATLKLMTIQVTKLPL
jgi:hypothetical protein